MIKAPQGYNINEEFDFYRQQAYRRYNKGGLEAVISFLTELLPVNNLISRILKKQYREYMSDEQSQQYNRMYESTLRGYRQIESEEELALYTASALLSRSRTAAFIITESAYRAAEDKDKDKNFLKKYNEAFMALYQLDFLSANDFVQFILYKFQIYNRRLRYDDLFCNYTPIIINPARANNPLKELMKQAINKNEFKYLWHLTRILPNMTMEMAEITEESLLEAGKKLTSNQYAHYINFCIRMTMRSSEDPQEKLKLLKDCCDKLCSVLSESRPEEVPFVRLMQLLGSVQLDFDNFMHYLNEYEYQRADRRDIANEHLRDLTDQVFEMLFNYRPSMVLAFIEKLKDNNPFHYSEYRDFLYAKRRANSTCRQWIETLGEHFEQPQIRDIFMNSVLRSCYPLSLFISDLLRADSPARADLLQFLKGYRFVGQIIKNEVKDRYELSSYSFRNENCLIKLGADTFQKNEKLKQFMDDPNETVMMNIRFVLRAAYFNDESGSYVTFSAVLPHDWQVPSFRRTRKYWSVLPDEENDDKPWSYENIE